MNMNENEIRELYNTYGHIIYGRCLRFLECKDEAKDAMQAVFMKLLLSYGTIRNKDRIVPWIFNTAKNYCLNHLRDKQKFDYSADHDLIPSIDRHDERMSAQQIIQFILSCHDKRVQDAVYFTYVEELEQSEIQKITGQSPATIRRNLKKFKDSIPHIKKRLGLL